MDLFCDRCDCELPDDEWYTTPCGECLCVRCYDARMNYDQQGACEDE